MTAPAPSNLVALALTATCVAGCASYAPLPLDRTAAPKLQLAQLRHAGPLPERLGVEDIATLALANNPELLAARNQRGVAEAQLTLAGIAPNPQIGASYAFVLGGPDTISAIAGSLSLDIRYLITRGAKLGAARQAVREIDASLLWQEWQTVGKARLQAVDVIEGEHQIRLLRANATLLEDRLARARTALAQGDTTRAALVPDLAAAGDAQRQLDDAARQQIARKRDLASLLGLAPTTPLPLAETAILPAIDAQAVLASLPGLADRRPDLVALQLGYASQEEKLRAAVLAQFPLLSLGVAGGRDTAGVTTLGPQITFDLPLFDRNQGNIALERATRQQLHEEFNLRLITARNELQALLGDRALLTSQLDLRSAQLAELEQTAMLAGAALQSGDLDERSAVELLVARNSRQQEVLALTQTLLEQQVAITTLAGTGMPTVSLTPPSSNPSVLPPAGLEAPSHSETRP